MAVIRFGLFEVDLRAGELRKDGIKLKLQQQPLHVLALLLEHPGEVVTRDELRRAIWPTNEFGSFDEGLDAAIYKLRGALGDSAEHPRFVETLPRRGYRFIAPIEDLVPSQVNQGLRRLEEGTVGAVPTSKRRRLAWAAGLFLLAAVGLTLSMGSRTVLLMRSRSAAPLDANLIAVAPFDVLAPNLELWREGLVDVLSQNLDGAGPVRTVPPSIVVRRWRGKADRASATTLGRLTGAQLVVIGTLVGVGRDSVRATATVLDVGRGKSLAELERGERVDRMDRLTDSLTVDVLHELSRTRPIASVRLGSLGTSSLPAMKLFLTGEQFYRRDEMDSAYVYYGRAVAVDNHFALAVNRRGRALSWTHGWFNPAAMADLVRAATLNRGLGTRDSLLLAVDSLGVGVSIRDTLDRVWWSLSSRLFDLLTRATSEYPQDAECWYELGVARLFYDHRPRATYDQALDAFDHAIALDSGFAPVYLLPIEIAFDKADSARALQYARAYVALDPSGSDADAIRLLLKMVGHPTADSAIFRRTLEAATPDMLMRLHNVLHRWPDRNEIGVRVVRLLAANPGPILFPGPCDALCRRQMLATVLSFRGHLSEARAITPMRNLASDFVLLGAIPPESISIIGANFHPKPGDPFLGLLWWWSTHGDTASLNRYARQVDSLAGDARHEGVQTYWRYVRGVSQAYASLGIHDTMDALRRFESLPDSVCPECTLPRLERAKLLVAVGRARQAHDELTEGERLNFSPSAVLVALQRGRLSEKLADWGGAVRGYRYVVDTWIHPDSSLEPYVTEAREALARLARAGKL